MLKDRKITTYILLSYGITWFLWGLSIALKNPVLLISSTTLAMWIPALSVLLTFMINKEPFPLREELKFRGKPVYWLIAWLLPAVFAIAGLLVYYLVFRNEFSLQNSIAVQVPEGSGLSPMMVVLIQLGQAVTFAPAVNALLAIGEEIGWRGFLYPALKERGGVLKAHLLTALFWAVWHTPLNMTGYNYGTAYPGFPFTGVLAMFVFCFSIGIFLSYLYEKTGSIWLPAVMHGAINAVSALGTVVQSTAYVNGVHTIFGPSLNGMLAGLPMLICALLLLRKEMKA